MNLIILEGYLGKDPETFTTNAGDKITSVSLATSESYKDQAGEWQTVTEWHNLKAYKLKADQLEKLKKGNRVLVQGKIKTRSYDYQNTGQKKYFTEIVVLKLTNLTPKESTPVYNDTATVEANQQLNNDGLPF